MKVRLCPSDWTDFSRSQEKCWLLTNGLGGYSSLTVAGGASRMDHQLLMAAVKAPNKRVQIIANLEETLECQGTSYSFFSQEFVNRTKNAEGFRYLDSFEMEAFPTWTYRAGGITVKKTIVMVQGENTLAVRYEVPETKKEGRLAVAPLLRFSPKGRNPEKGMELRVEEDRIIGGGLILYYKTNGSLQRREEEWIEDLYYEQDSRDGRDAVGAAVKNHRILFPLTGKAQTFCLVYSLQGPVEGCIRQEVESWMDREYERREKIIQKSGISHPVGQALAVSAAQYVVERESTGGKSILAGYPYFEDWGRDTMIALPGCTLAIGAYEDCKSILRTFMAYCRRGLMPNLFPEGDQEPLYNTVDASLLFVESAYQYYKETGDEAFLREAYPVMEDICFWYQRGTDFHIHMDEDGLIMAGEGLEQVTWMDVRIGEELPTPRHGKPVEVNALWYNALRILEELSPLVGKAGVPYGGLAQRVKESFLEAFWMEEKGWLRDVVNGTYEEEQFRCSQVFALSLSYSMLTKAQGRRILAAVRERLYTPVGLRSLAPEDPAFHPVYGGSQPERDRAYHQGTVWAFPLGAYYRGLLACGESLAKAREEVRQGLESLEGWLLEGCLFHLAEIYDGLRPTASRGCYGQAWSVGELLRAFRLSEKEG